MHVQGHKPVGILRRMGIGIRFGKNRGISGSKDREHVIEKFKSLWIEDTPYHVIITIVLTDNSIQVFCKTFLFFTLVSSLQSSDIWMRIQVVFGNQRNCSVAFYTWMYTIVCMWFGYKQFLMMLCRLHHREINLG